MLDAVALLGTLGVVPLVHGTNQITGDAADALETDTLAQFFVAALNGHSKTSLSGDALESGHLGIQSSQFFHTLGRDLLALAAAAAGTDITDDAHIAAHGVAVHGMVDAAVADAQIVHTADDVPRLLAL